MLDTGCRILRILVAGCGGAQRAWRRAKADSVRSALCPLRHALCAMPSAPCPISPQSNHSFAYLRTFSFSHLPPDLDVAGFGNISLRGPGGRSSPLARRSFSSFCRFWSLFCGLRFSFLRLHFGFLRLRSGFWRLRPGFWGLPSGFWGPRPGFGGLRPGFFQLRTGFLRLRTGFWGLRTGF